MMTMSTTLNNTTMHTAGTSTDAFTLQRLSTDKEEDLRAAVAGNQNTPQSVLWELSLDSSDLVRDAVAGNPTTGADILRSMSIKTDTKRIMNTIITNKSAPGDVLHMLTAWLS